ncbi:reverse transcriptase domain-containing protein, partial [Tanacetum coccineum]
RIAMAIEVKNKNGGLKIEEDVKEHIVESDNKKKVTVTTNNLNNFCEKCQISGHVEEKCWKAHPELFPKNGVSAHKPVGARLHLQANGQAEVAGCEIVKGVEKQMKEYKTCWVNELSIVLWAHRTTPK